MILCPVQNTEKFLQNWLQVRPRISQFFGENPAMYKQFGLNGHNGLDIAIPIGTKLFAPIEGKLTTGDQGSAGYGKYVRITKDNVEITLGHLSELPGKEITNIFTGDFVGLSGNTGNSTGPHLHLGMRIMCNGQIQGYDNGFKGAIDPLSYIITWKGGFINQTI